MTSLDGKTEDAETKSTLKVAAIKNEYQIDARTALLALALTAALALNTTAIAQAPPGSLWYNGDWNNVNGLANERNTAISQASVYDDFNVTAPMWHVTAVFSDNLVSAIVIAADWEIRTGVSEGNAGTLVASGTTNSPLVTPTGRGQEFIEYMVEVTGLNVFLPMLPSGQHYWINVTPVGNGFGRSFNSTTSGANCVGTPCGNDQNAFWNSTSFGTYFDHTYNNHGDGQNDYSMGVIGTAVPEPATVALLTCGVGALLIALRRRRALLPGLTCVALVVLNRTAIAQAPPGSLWYNGDFNYFNGLANERNTAVTQAAVYDDFAVTGGPAWHVTAVFSDNLMLRFFPPIMSGADWEIRSGVSEGNAGTLIASGTTSSPVVIPTGRGGDGSAEYMVEVTGLNLTLPALPAGQEYWLNVTPVGNDVSRSFNSTTSGANCVGTCGSDPVHDAFFNSTFFGAFFQPTQVQGQDTNFSNGVIGTVVPEPATVALLICGLGALLIALRRRRRSKLGQGFSGQTFGRMHQSAYMTAPAAARR